jgi:broad specificity phosphatase PhoE
MKQNELQFMVVNDPEHDFDLMQEAQLGDWTVADVRKVGGRWLITFFPPWQEGRCEIPWETFLKISQRFTGFIHEMEHPPSTNVESMGSEEGPDVRR